MSIFSFSHCVFYPSEALSAIFIKFENVVCKLFEFEIVQNFPFGKGLIVTFQLSSAASLNLGWSQNGALGNGLTLYKKVFRFIDQNKKIENIIGNDDYYHCSLFPHFFLSFKDKSYHLGVIFTLFAHAFNLDLSEILQSF